MIGETELSERYEKLWRKISVPKGHVPPPKVARMPIVARKAQAVACVLASDRPLRIKEVWKVIGGCQVTTSNGLYKAWKKGILGRRVLPSNNGAHPVEYFRP